jgi:predicted glycosyl hydrolase (DUF1957 family)
LSTYVVIEESKDLATMKVEELQAYLKAHEQRINERNAERRNDQALQANISRTMARNGKARNTKEKCLGTRLKEQ